MLLVTHVQIRTRITEEVAVQVAPLVNNEARFWAVWAQCPKLAISTLYHLLVASSIIPQLLFGFNHRSWVGYMLVAMWIFSGYWWDCNGGHPGTLCSRIQAVAKLHCGINTVGMQYKVLLTWSNKRSGYWAMPKQEKPEGSNKNQSVQFSCSVVSNSAAPSTAAHQASLSITNSQSLLKLMSIKSVMPSNHLILCRPLLLLPSIFPSIRVFPNESVLRIRWSKYWNVSFTISPSNEYSRLISFRMDWFDLLAVQRNLKSLLQHHSPKASFLRCSAFSIVQPSHLPGAGAPPVAKVMRKEAWHTQRWDWASGVPLEILEHLPPKPESAYSLLCALTYTSLTLRGAVPHHLSLKKELTYSSS